MELAPVLAQSIFEGWTYYIVLAVLVLVLIVVFFVIRNRQG
jgi:hypothetical protein